ncbi:hypothetical protein ZWY2020_040485 [Hordeum vulgare]|nr:hypothetical protein ZWY2020_040485 [Hordeum vulgare]
MALRRSAVEASDTKRLVPPCGVDDRWAKAASRPYSAGESLRKELEEMGVLVDSVKIRYSLFSRTTETARVVAGVLGVPFEGPGCKAAMAGVPYWEEEEDGKKEGLGMSGYWVAVAFKYLPHGTSLYSRGKRY